MAESLPAIGNAPASGRGERVRGGGRSRRGVPNPARQEFLGGILTEDVQTLVAWHHDRPEHEQRRLLKTLGSLYNSYKDYGTKQRDLNSAGIGALKAGEELLAGGVNEGDGEVGAELRKSESAPDLQVKQLKPIDVFEKKRREGASGRRKGVGGNSLQGWLEQESNASTAAGTETTFASSWTGVSSMSKTSLASSTNSAPCTTTKMAYQRHKRALAVNRRKWATRKAHDPGVLQDGLPTDNYPDERRLITSMVRDFGSRPLGQGISSKMWENVFAEDKHSFVEEHLANADPAERESFKGMVRALQNLRRIRHFSTAYERQYDADENQRLWKPPKEKPSVDPANLTRSQIPLGTIESIVNFCQQRQEQNRSRPMPPISKADILVVDHENPYAASSAGDDAMSMRSDPLYDNCGSDPGAGTPSSAGYRNAKPPPKQVPPVSLPPLAEGTQESQE